MKIKDIVSSAASYLGQENVLSYLEDPSTNTEAQSTVDRLVRLANLVISELACSGFTAIITETCYFTNKIFYVSRFQHNPVKIVRAVDNVKRQPVEYTNDGYKLSCSYPIVYITYEYIPPIMGLDDSFEFANGLLGIHAIAMGLAAEYCLTTCDFECAVLWHERFVEQLKKTTSVKNSQIKGRDWL